MIIILIFCRHLHVNHAELTLSEHDETCSVGALWRQWNIKWMTTKAYNPSVTIENLTMTVKWTAIEFVSMCYVHLHPFPFKYSKLNMFCKRQIKTNPTFSVVVTWEFHSLKIDIIFNSWNKIHIRWSILYHYTTECYKYDLCMVLN